MFNEKHCCNTENTNLFSSFFITEQFNSSQLILFLSTCKLEELIVTHFVLCQIQWKAQRQVNFMMRLWRGLNLKSDLLLRPTVSLDPMLEKKKKKEGVLTEKCYSPSTEETPLERMVYI